MPFVEVESPGAAATDFLLDPNDVKLELVDDRGLPAATPDASKLVFHSWRNLS